MLEADLCPVWVSEFGADTGNAEEMQWLKAFTQTLAASDADWAYWPLNVGPKPSCGSNEAYGMLAPDWRPKDAGDERLELLKQIGLAPKTPPSMPGLSAPIPELLKTTSEEAGSAILSRRPAWERAAGSTPIVASNVAAVDDVAAPAPIRFCWVCASTARSCGRRRGCWPSSYRRWPWQQNIAAALLSWTSWQSRATGEDFDGVWLQIFTTSFSTQPLRKPAGCFGSLLPARPERWVAFCMESGPPKRVHSACPKEVLPFEAL